MARRSSKPAGKPAASASPAPKRRAKKVAAPLSLEAQLWSAADALRNSMDAANCGRMRNDWHGRGRR